MIQKIHNMYREYRLAIALTMLATLVISGMSVEEAKKRIEL